MKFTQAEDHVQDLEETFSMGQRYALKLNPSKCYFGVRSGMFLGYMVTERRIETNPKKIHVL